MLKEDLENKYVKLESHLMDLMLRYIAPHLDPMQTPKDYDFDVHSFCILSHAAFEEFVEDVTLYSIDRIEREFKSVVRKFSYATLCFLHFDEHPLSLNEDKKWSDILNDYMMKRINERKSELSKYAKTENHGIDIKYLRKLLIPIGIDVPRNPKHTNSLDKLKQVRGAYAHSYNRVQNSLAPEDAENIVLDVLEMFKAIKDKAINMSYYIL